MDFAQNFTLTKDELGVTRVQGISSQDMEKVRSLSLIELTALFDSHGLALHRRKPVKRRVRGKMYQVGVILTAVLCVAYSMHAKVVQVIW